MKKFLFVAVLAAGTLVACNDNSNMVNGVDTTTQMYRDSVANAAGTSTPMMGTGSDTMSTGTNGGSMMGTDTSSSMMGSDSGSTMMSGDSTNK